MTDHGSVLEWTAQQRKLLALEHDSEKLQLTDKIESLTAKECEDAGLSLLSMSIESVTTALFGRCCLSLVRSDSRELLKSFKVGDEVVVYCPKLRHTPEFAEVECIVSKLLPASIQLICDVIDESIFDTSIRVDARANDSSYRKYLNALNDLESSALPLMTLLFGDKEFQSLSLGIVEQTQKRIESINADQIKFFDPNLNDSQRKAVANALEMKQITVIHGPPGTGKTSTVVELIQQSATQHRSVLVCAPSNVAVDNILERLILAKEGTINDKEKSTRNKLKFVRLGHPARISQRSAHYCLDSLIARDDGTDIVADVRSEIDGLRKDLLRCKKKDRNKRREIQSELRTLYREARNREDAVVKSIIQSVDVVLCTCVTAGSRLLKDIHFDIVIIDEAAQALEVSCWIPLMMSSRCVLVGDHKQLPPTVKSAAAASMGLAITLFERVIMNSVFKGAGLIHLLDTQYRMNSSICDWSSDHMYGGQVQSHLSVKNRTVRDVLEDKGASSSHVPRPSKKVDVIAPEGEGAVVFAESDSPFGSSEVLPVLLLLDTTGCDVCESSSKEGSRSNYGEAQIVLQHVLYLLDTLMVPPRDVGVITPYNGQLSVLKQLFGEKSENDPRLSMVDVKTIDGFQGGEKECIVISMVRSNTKREVGFLNDKRRINVAVTRAKVHLAIICDVDTCLSDPFIGTLLNHISSVGVHVGIMEVTYLTTYQSVSTFDAGAKQFQDHEKAPRKRGQAQIVTKLKKESLLKVRSVQVAEPKSDLHHHTGLALDTVCSPANIQSEIERLVCDLIASTLIIEEGVTKAISQGNGEFQSGIAVLKVQPFAAKAISNVDGTSTVFTFLRFPSFFDSNCRRLVHEVATRSSLFHRSIGIPPNRFIEVSLVPFPVVEVAITLLSNPTTSLTQTVDDEDRRLNCDLVFEDPGLDSKIDGQVAIHDAAVESDIDGIRRIRAEKYLLSKSPTPRKVATKQPTSQKKIPGIKICEKSKEGVIEDDDASYLEQAILENQVLLTKDTVCAAFKKNNIYKLDRYLSFLRCPFVQTSTKWVHHLSLTPTVLKTIGNLK